MIENHKILDYEEDKNALMLAKNKDENALDYIMNKYKFLVLSKARLYFLIGGTEDDLIQEGMIGLYKAIENFDIEKYGKFRSFAELCIQRQMISAVRTATRQKHTPLNTYISFNKTVGEGETEQSYLDFMGESDLLNPEKLLIGQENKNFLETQMIKNLSGLEMKVLMLYIKGDNYEQIAEILGKTEKSVDNALQRLKKKLQKILEEKKLDEL